MLKKLVKLLKDPGLPMLLKHPGIILTPDKFDNEHYVDYLRRNGATIGEKTIFIDPSRCAIDPGRLDYITIGNNCCLSVVNIIAHDYSWYTFLDAFDDILPDPGGEVVIGNNCFIGYQSCILKGTTIGDNVIIGARSVVKGNIPSNTVWAGTPAKMICTLEDLYKKRKETRATDAIYRREHIKKVKGRNPTIEEMGMFGFLFLERTEEMYEKYIKNIIFNGLKASPKVKENFFSTVPLFSSFEEFLEFEISEETEKLS